MSNNRRPFTKGERPLPSEPGVTLHFRNSDHYAEWLNQRQMVKAVQVIEGVSSSAGVERYTALRDALIEALEEPEQFNEAQAIVAMRQFFKLGGK